MKIYRCPECKRTQKKGKYCLDDGSRLEEVYTKDEVKFRKIKTKRTSEQIKRDIRRWLTRIGVNQPDIKIVTENDSAYVEYVLNKSMYNFSSHLQDSITNNLAAVEQFLHYRVLGIERGIETTEQAFSGYESIPDLRDTDKEDPYEVLGFKGKVSLEEAKAKFKKLVKIHHPDRDGNAEQFNRIKTAIKKIEERELG